jgi:[glutamine synthetase] adenylyltransferase / [glutamine synthetase]-adenylyl-L-tyrosine phosphorylase
MISHIESLVKTHDWPLGTRIAASAIVFDLASHPAEWDETYTTLSGVPSERLRIMKLAAMQAFWQATLEGKKRAATGRNWSFFADWCLETALKEAWNLPANRKFLKSLTTPESAVPGLFILGLGKLGGCDLNFSSDVDLIAFFDAETLPVPENDGRGYVTARVLRDMGKILGNGSAEPTWRVDWRLRPDPSVTDLSMSAEAGLSYFHFQSEPWRRLAMMKARVVAGDLHAGARFMNDLKPFLWRKSLDFRMIDEIAELKSRIRNENPDIAEHSTDSDDLSIADDFHFKLDRGGIREIEFIANALQLVWGGRQPQLRVTHTETALKELGQAGLLDADKANRLISSYHQFRGLENAVQGMNNAQEYRVPKAKTERNLIAALAGFSDWKAAEKRIIIERAFVHDAFQNLFKGAEEAVPAQSITGLKLNKESLLILEEWRGGFVRCGVTGDMRATLRHLPEAILAALPTSSIPDVAIAALDTFFRQLPPGGQYLSLMAAQPQFLADIVEPIVTGGWAARLMSQSPHVADSLIERRGDLTSNLVPKLEDVAFLNSERDYEARLEAFRALVNERVFLSCLAFQRGLLDHAEATRALTGIAEIALAIGCRLVADEYFKGKFASETDMPIAIVAMGKFGLAELTPGSDLDLVYLAREDADLDTADRFARRLSTALGTKMRGGVVYEIDTRLRPSGNAGPPVLRLSTLKKHQMERANTWEHLALVPARLVYGGKDKAAAFEAVKAKAVSRPRDKIQSARDAHKMLARLREHRIKPAAKNVLAIKLRPGGLMEAEYLAAFLSLQAGRSVYDHPELMPEALRNGITLWRHLQLIARTLGVEDQAITDPQNIISRLPASLQLDDLFAGMNAHADAVTKLIDEMIIKPSGLKGKALEAWEDGSVVDPL